MKPKKFAATVMMIETDTGCDTRALLKALGLKKFLPTKNPVRQLQL